MIRKTSLALCCVVMLLTSSLWVFSNSEHLSSVLSKPASTPTSPADINRAPRHVVENVDALSRLCAREHDIVLVFQNMKSHMENVHAVENAVRGQMQALEPDVHLQLNSVAAGGLIEKVLSSRSADFALLWKSEHAGGGMPFEALFLTYHEHAGSLVASKLDALFNTNIDAAAWNPNADLCSRDETTVDAFLAVRKSELLKRSAVGTMAQQAATARRLRSEVAPRPIQRRKGLTPEMFKLEFFDLGVPVIITDGMKDWPSFQDNLFQLDALKMQFQEFNRTMKDMSTAFGLRLQDRESVEYVRKQYSFPKVLDQFKWKTRNTEFFFFADKEHVSKMQGTYLHLDETCGNTFAAHYNGIKRWLLVPITDQVDSEHDKGPSDDISDMHHRLPSYEADVGPGEILFFPGGYWHSTTIIQTPMLTMSVYWDGAVGNLWTTGLWDTMLSVPKYASCGGSWRHYLCHSE